MAAEWFVQADGAPLGPLAPADLRRMVQEGRVGAETLVRLGADGKWVAAARVRGLLPDAEAKAPAAASAPARNAAPVRSAPALPLGRAKAESPPLVSPNEARRAAASSAPSAANRLGREPAANPASRPATSRAAPTVEQPEPPATPAGAFSAGLPAELPPSKLLTNLGFASLACGALGFLMAAWSTAAMVGLTALGVVIAIAAIVWGLVRRRTGFGMPITGALICLGIVGIVLAFQFIEQRFSGRLKLESTNRRSTGETMALSDAESEMVRFENDTQWTRGDRPSTIGNVEVSVTSASVDQVTLNDLGSEQESDDKFFIVRIAVRNVDRSKKVEYSSWSGSGALTDVGLAMLTDRDGKPYPREDFGVGLRVAGQVTAASLDPEKAVEDVLVFKATGEESDVYRLELPGSAVGEDGAFRFALPAAMIQRPTD